MIVTCILLWNRRFIRSLAWLIPAFSLFIARAVETPSEILFLDLEEADSGSFRLLEAERRPGRLKTGNGSGGSVITFQLTDATGSILSSGPAELAPGIRLEFESEDSSGGLQQIAPPVLNHRWKLRLPAIAGASRAALWRRASSGRGFDRAALGPVESRFLGEFELGTANAVSRPISPQALGNSVFKQLVDNGPRESRINLVVLSEGYRSAELTQFEADARKLSTALFKVPHWGEYAALFNVFIIEVASNESGSDHPSQGVFKDTYFSSSFDSYGLERLLTIPPNDLISDYTLGQGRVAALLKQHVPDYDLVLMLVNDTTYGGSGGSPAIASLNTQSAEILIHEIGHSYAGLGDEYDSPFPAYPDIEEPNTTRTTTRSELKWGAWVDSKTPLPTPETSAYASVVGAFEGAHYHSSGWYRPKLSCKMNSLGVGFCEVCAEAHIIGHYRRVSILDSFTPSTTLLELSGNAVTNFLVQPLPLSGRPMEIRWSVNGVVKNAASTNRFDVAAVDLGNGDHRIEALVFDPTVRVRTDPQNLLRKSQAWTVRVSGVTVPVRLGPLIVGADGSVRVTVSGGDVYGVALEASADLVQWSTVTTATVHSGSLVLLDTSPSSVRGARRYYRAVRR